MFESPSPPICLLPDSDLRYLLGSAPLTSEIMHWAHFQIFITTDPIPHSGTSGPDLEASLLCTLLWVSCTTLAENPVLTKILWSGEEVNQRSRRQLDECQGGRWGRPRQSDWELPAEVRSQVICRLWGLRTRQGKLTILQEPFIKHLPGFRHPDYEVWSVNDCLCAFCKGRN